MCVSRRRVHHPVTEQVADHREALTQRESTGRERVSQGHAGEPRRGRRVSGRDPRSR